MPKSFDEVKIETVDHFMKPLANPKVDATVPDHFDGDVIKPFTPAPTPAAPPKLTVPPAATK